MTRRIPTLDGWRAVAILMVVISHVATSFYGAEPEYYRMSPARYGTLGVDIFFGLSGLLICKLLLEEFEGSGGIDLGRFYVRRAFRILPPCLALIAAAGLLGLVRSRWELASCLLFFRNYLPASLGGYALGHLWSLGVEEHFYLAWPALLAWAGMRRGFYMAGSLAAACAMWRAVELRVELLPRLIPGLLPGGRTDLRFDSLLWGCVAAFLIHRPDTRELLRRHLSLSVWLLLIAAFVFCVLFHPFLAPMWQAMLIPLLLAGTLLHPLWQVSRALDLAPLRLLGRMSYSLYLWQQLFWVAGWTPEAATAPIWRRLPLNLLAMLACAAASYYLLEKPLIRIGHKLAGRTGFSRTVGGTAGAPDVAPAATLS